MIEKLSTPLERVIAFELSGTLHDEDYETFVPLVDSAISEHGKARLLVHFLDFHGWDAQALWDDIKFATTHCNKIEKLALVGESAWEKWMAKICKPFTMAQVRYFSGEQMDAALKWLDD